MPIDISKIDITNPNIKRDESNLDCFMRINKEFINIISP